MASPCCQSQRTAGARVSDPFAWVRRTASELPAEWVDIFGERYMRHPFIILTALVAAVLGGVACGQSELPNWTTVTRIDPSAVVLCRTEARGLEAGCVKLFGDSVARRLVNRVAFDLRSDVSFAGQGEAERVLESNWARMKAAQPLDRIPPLD